MSKENNLCKYPLVSGVKFKHILVYRQEKGPTDHETTSPSRHCGDQVSDPLCSDFFLLVIHAVDISQSKQGAVLKGVGGKSVVRRVPDTPAANPHALIVQLSDVDEDDYFISRYHQVLHSGFNYLEVRK